MANTSGYYTDLFWALKNAKYKTKHLEFSKFPLNTKKS